MNNLKVGIAGYGVVGMKRHECINLHHGLELTAVCDKKFLDKKDFIGQNVALYVDYKDLLNEDLDILIVCMTNDIASEVTIAGLENGLHVFCEKPPGKSIEDIQKVRLIEKKYPDQKLMYGFNHRYHESVKEALMLIKSNKFGNIVNMRGVYGKSRLVTFNQSDWRTNRKIAGGGILLDQGIHMVDLMRLFAGEFEEIQSFISNKFWNFDVEDNAYAIMRTNDGVVAMLNSSATQWKHLFNLEIGLENGTIELTGILSGSKSYGNEKLIISYVDHELGMGSPPSNETSYTNDTSWFDEVSEFYNNIVNNTKIIHSSSLDALKTMELVYKIYYADPVWSKKYNIHLPS